MKFPEDRAHFLIQGAAGNIELATTSPVPDDSEKVAIICHPHPLQGGTMENKVVTTLVRTFHDMGVRTVRFNFRGVGQSEGQHDEGIGETHDLLTVFEWVKSNCPGFEIYLAGFSFGSYIAHRAATATRIKENISLLISIAPPVQYPGFHQLPAPEMPWLIVQGEDDEIVDARAVFEWASEFDPVPEIIRFPGTGHFFHGKLVELKNTLKESLS
jgi:alpha/beta superfamily hydrolase